MPRVHRVAALPKRWILGTHQGAVSHEHLGYYLDEFTFRFNRRTSQHRGKLFYRLLQQAVQTGPMHGSELKKGVRSGPEKRPRRRKENLNQLDTPFLGFPIFESFLWLRKYQRS